MKDPHQAFFARWSKFYEATPLLAKLLRRQQDLALERLGAAPGERVLDLSCGPGRALQALTGAGAIAVGLDASPHMLVAAREAGLREPLVWAEAGHLPFRDASFTAILCTNAFHHYPEPLATLRELRRVLAPGGRAVLVDPLLDSAWSRLAIYGGEALLFGMSVHLHGCAEWRTLCSAAGFARATAEPIATFPLPATSVLVTAHAG